MDFYVGIHSQSLT